MIAVDTNILVYAHREDSAWHKPAAVLIRELAEGTVPWCIPWPCIHEFLAIATHPRVYKPPTPLQAALEQVDLWLGSPSLRVIGESEDYWAVLQETLSRSKVKGPAIHDARIMSIALQHGVDLLYSADRDFSRFAQIRVVNPLIGEP